MGRTLLIALAVMLLVGSMSGLANAVCQSCGPDINGSNSCFNSTQGVSDCHIENNQCAGGVGCGFCDCFLAGTPVMTAEGPKPIEQVEVGDRILSAGPDGKLRYSWVVRTLRYLQNEYLVINGVVRTTSTQPFWVQAASPIPAALEANYGWRTAAELRVGDSFLDMDGRSSIINTIERVDRGVRTYNLLVEGDHTFFVHGYLVHNKEECQQW